MKIDEQKLKDRIQEIQEVCLVNGEPIPYAFNRGFAVPYRLTEEELRKIEVSEENKEKLKEAYAQRRAIEKQIFRGEHPKYDHIRDYCKDEIKGFIKRYPQFEDIISWD